MATSFYFNKQPFTEQKLVEDLVVESIKIHGIDLKYLPRTLVNQDQIFEEDLLSLFKRAYTIEGYVREVNGYGGRGDLISKFGLEIRDTMSFVISQRRFEEEVGNSQQTPRPYEGDIIYVPMTNDYMEIKYVITTTPFFTLGKNYVYEIKCEKLEYSSERIITGIPDIDKVVTQFSVANTGPISITTEDLYTLTTQSSNNIIIEFEEIGNVEKYAQNEELQEESEQIIDFSVNNPFGVV